MSPQFVAFARQTPFGALNRHFIWDQFDGKVHDRAHMVQCFAQHIENVKAAIEPERLLIYEVKQGWAPLCSFLGVPAPNEPFPHVNSREETTRMLAMILAGASDSTMEERMKGAASALTKSA